MFSFFSCKKIESQPQQFTIFGEVTMAYEGLSIVSDNNEKINFESNTSTVSFMVGDRVFVFGELISQNGNTFAAKLLNLSVVDIISPYPTEVDREQLGNENLKLEQDNIMITGNYLNIFMNSTSVDHDISMYIISAEENSTGAMVVEAELCNKGEAIDNSQIISVDISKYDTYKTLQLKLKYKYATDVYREKSLTRTK